MAVNLKLAGLAVIGLGAVAAHAAARWGPSRRCIPEFH